MEKKGDQKEVIRQLTAKINRLEKGNAELRRKSGGYNNPKLNPGRFNNNPGKSYESMRGDEKVRMTCADFNSTRGCIKVEARGSLNTLATS